jgi:hypothetical protein
MASHPKFLFAPENPHNPDFWLRPLDKITLIYSQNFFISHMKRKILFRLACLAVMTFLGASGLSAQSWLPEQQALIVIQSQVSVLSAPVAVGQQAGGANLDVSTKVTANSEAAKKGLKTEYLKSVAAEIKGGATTGAAVTTVHGMILQASSGIDRGALITEVHDEVVALLSN